MSIVNITCMLAFAGAGCYRGTKWCLSVYEGAAMGGVMYHAAGAWWEEQVDRRIG